MAGARLCRLPEQHPWETNAARALEPSGDPVWTIAVGGGILIVFRKGGAGIRVPEFIGGLL